MNSPPVPRFAFATLFAVVFIDLVGLRHRHAAGSLLRRTPRCATGTDHAHHRIACALPGGRHAAVGRHERPARPPPGAARQHDRPRGIVPDDGLRRFAVDARAGPDHERRDGRQPLHGVCLHRRHHHAGRARRRHGQDLGGFRPRLRRGSGDRRPARRRHHHGGRQPDAARAVAAALFSFAAAVAIYFFLPETQHQAARDDGARRAPQPGSRTCAASRAGR